MSRIKQEEWFQFITGVNEDVFRKCKDKVIKESISSDSKIEFSLFNESTQQNYCCGCFEQIPLHELRKIDTTPQCQCIFEIIVRSDMFSRDQVEVGHMQAMKEYNNCTFLVASNFNAVEAVNEVSSPDLTYFTTEYIYDMTQGPAASLSCPAAAIQRVHFPFYDKTLPHEKWCQTSQNQIEMLGGLKEYYEINNGYPQIPELKSIPTEDDYNKYIACLQTNAEVTLIREKREFVVVPKEERNKVDQIFCAAVNLRQGGGIANKSKCEKHPILKELPLDCGYEAAYLCSIRNRRKKLILTLLGNGAFGNETEEVCKSIIKAHLKYGIKQNGTLEKVILPIFTIGGGDVLMLIVELLKTHSIPYKITLFTNNKESKDQLNL